MTHAVRKIGLVLSVLVMLPLLVSAADKTDPKKRTTYKQDEVLTEAENCFGNVAKGIAEVIQKAFKDQGEPNAFIAGEEAGGAVGVGVRYGKGTLKEYGGGSRTVYWQGPSIGFDIGGERGNNLLPSFHRHREQKTRARG